MENNKDLYRLQGQVEFFKSQFEEYVRDTSNSVRSTEEKIDKLESKVDKIVTVLDDGKFNDRKGIISQTSKNAEKIDAIQKELAAWRRATVIVGTALAGIGVAARYLWTLTKNAMGI